MPIIEPEVDIHCPEKSKAEELLKANIVEGLNQLPADQRVLLKLTLPDQADFYADFVRHPKVVRVLALSGGYTRDEANERLRKNHGVVASYSAVLVEGLTAQQTDAEFNARWMHRSRAVSKRPPPENLGSRGIGQELRHPDQRTLIDVILKVSSAQVFVGHALHAD